MNCAGARLPRAALCWRRYLTASQRILGANLEGMGQVDPPAQPSGRVRSELLLLQV